MRKILLSIFVLVSITAQSQIGKYLDLHSKLRFQAWMDSLHANTIVVGTDASPAASSIMDLVSTTKGLLIPRMTYAQRNAISSPATGLSLFNTQTNKFNYYNGSAWKVPIDSGYADIDYGTYTPTLDNTTNVAGSTAYQFKWSRVGNVYTVSGEVDIDPTTTATLTVLGIPLPLSSAIANTFDVAGTASDDLGTAARVRGDIANGRAELRMTPVDVTNRRFSVHFTFYYVAP